MWKMSDHEDDQVLGDDQENEDDVGGEGGAEEVEEVCSLLTFNLAGLSCCCLHCPHHRSLGWGVLLDKTKCNNRLAAEVYLLTVYCLVELGKHT